MVQHSASSNPSPMGQAGMCGVNTPGTDSLNLISNTSSNSHNGTASEVQASLDALDSYSKDVDPNELLIRLRMVIQENLELKETISQNNMALRQQLSLIARWSLQCQQQQQKQQQDLSDTTQQLNTLQRENQLLNTQKGPDSNSEINSIVTQLNTQLTTSELNLQKARTEINNVGATKSKLETDMTFMKRDLTTAKGEQERLLLERFEHMSTINELREQLRFAKAGMIAPLLPSPAASVYEAVGGTISEVEIHKLRNDLLKEQDTTMTLLQELHDTRNKMETLRLDLNHVKENASAQKQQYNQILVSRTSVHEYGIDAKKSDIGTAESMRLKDEAAVLKEEVDTLENALSEERKKLTEERAALLRSHTDIARLKKDLLEANRDSNRSSDKFYENKIKTLNEEFDGATAKLLSYEELLAAKNEQISKLKKEIGQTKAQLSEVSSERETIAVLRAQVEVYHADFKAEREAREAIANDREKLKDEVRHLHQRNTQLVDELEAYQRRSFDNRSGSEQHSRDNEAPTAAAEANTGSMTTESLWEIISAASDKKEEEPKKSDAAPDLDENLFYCPKCNKTFTEIRPLEEHANKCLDED